MSRNVYLNTVFRTNIVIEISSLTRNMFVKQGNQTHQLVTQNTSLKKVNYP